MTSSELITNADGSIYHLALQPEDVGELIFLVGDQNRVERVSRHFDTVDVRKSKREFVTHTGMIGQQRVSCISTGIGTDNIDIVLNELDALANIDLTTGQAKVEHTSLQFIRLGTSGGFQEWIDVGTIVISAAAIGLDGLHNAYHWDGDNWQSSLDAELVSSPIMTGAYYVKASPDLVNRFASLGKQGITLTCAGFYGPQGRQLRLSSKLAPLMPLLRKASLDNMQITNLEMETSGIYLLARLLGHSAVSVNAILANRYQRRFSEDPGVVVDQMIEAVIGQFR